MATITAVQQLLTTRDVEREFRIPEGTLRYYRSSGIGPASFRLGGRVRYRRAEVLAWIAEQEVATRRGGVHA
jgi:predicted DNA-binding transcriptional regulator AlpA